MTADQLKKHIGMDDQQLRLVARALLSRKTIDNVSAFDAMTLLVCDFLREVGMSTEQYIDAVDAHVDVIEAYADALTEALEHYEKAKIQTLLPWGFFTMIDNRYTGVYIVNMSESTKEQTDLWDIVDNKAVMRPQLPPIFTLTLSLGGMFLKTVAEGFGYRTAAERFRRGELVTSGEDTW